jgi:hypothetical protein
MHVVYGQIIWEDEWEIHEFKDEDKNYEKLNINL